MCVLPVSGLTAVPETTNAAHPPRCPRRCGAPHITVPRVATPRWPPPSSRRMPFPGPPRRRLELGTPPTEIGTAPDQCITPRSAGHRRTVRRRASRAMWWWCGSRDSSGGTHCVRKGVADRRGSEAIAVCRRAVRAATPVAPRPPRRRCTIVPTQVRPLPLVCSTIQSRIVVCACPVDPLWYPLSAP